MTFIPGQEESLRERVERREGYSGTLKLWVGDPAELRPLRFRYGQLLTQDAPKAIGADSRYQLAGDYQPAGSYADADHTHVWSGATVTMTADLTVGSGGAPGATVAWDSEEEDTGGCHDPAADTLLTAPEDGVYMVGVNLRWDAGGGAVYAIATEIVETGGPTVLARDRHTVEAASESSYCLERRVRLTAGQSVEVQVTQDSGVDQVLALESIFWIQYVSA